MKKSCKDGCEYYVVVAHEEHGLLTYTTHMDKPVSTEDEVRDLVWNYEVRECRRRVGFPQEVAVRTAELTLVSFQLLNESTRGEGVVKEIGGFAQMWRILRLRIQKSAESTARGAMRWIEQDNAKTILEFMEQLEAQSKQEEGK